MGSYAFGTVALASQTGTKAVTHGVLGLTANPPTGNAFAVLLADTTAAPGYSVTAFGSVTMQVSQTATNVGTVNFWAGAGVRAVQF